MAGSFKNSKGVGMGIESIIIIFITLCVVIFGTLALLTSSYETSLNVKTRKAAEDYYAADAKAVNMIAYIDETVLLAKQTASESKSEIEAFGDLLANKSDIRLYNKDEEKNSTAVNFQITVDELRLLNINLTVFFDRDGIAYDITSYEVQTGKRWNEMTNEDLNLITWE